MKNIRVSIINPTTLKLEEKGDIGDTIDLRNVQSVDTAPILEAIRLKKDDVYQDLIERERHQQESDQKITLAAFDKERASLIADFDIEKSRFSSEIGELKRKIEEQKNIAILETQAENQEIIAKIKQEHAAAIFNKEQEVQRLTSNIEAIKEKQALFINEEKMLVESKYKDELSIKERMIAQLTADSHRKMLEEEAKRQVVISEAALLKEKLASIEQIKKAELESAKAELTTTFQQQINQKEVEIERLRMARSSLQVKTIGEELESWCNSEFESYSLSGFENCSWNKDNDAVKETPDGKKTKADYIFDVFVDSKKHEGDKLLSVCCEMKNEAPDSKTKSKNADHYLKLNKDRERKKCQYALLISELEWDSVNDTPIKKVAEYENMYIVRPAYFISFLSLIKSLAGKYQDLLMVRRMEDEKFKDSQDILNEFDAFKKTYLDKPLASLLSDVEDIKKEANKSYEASYKIIGLADTIISNKISEIKVKIERFDIRKIARKIDKLS